MKIDRRRQYEEYISIKDEERLNRENDHSVGFDHYVNTDGAESDDYTSVEEPMYDHPSRIKPRYGYALSHYGNPQERDILCEDDEDYVDPSSVLFDEEDY